MAAVAEFVPKKKIKGKNSPPSITGDIVHTIRRKETPTNQSLKEKFKQLRKDVKQMVCESRANFFNSLDNIFQENPKRFWSLFKLANKSASVPVHMKLGVSFNTDVSDDWTMAADTPNDIAELFNLHFTYVFSEIVSDDVSTNNVQPTVSGPWRNYTVQIATENSARLSGLSAELVGPMTMY